MQGFAPRITSIKGLSQRNRLPRLGKIRLGLKVKNKNVKNPGCGCGPEEGCFKCSYPVETAYFVVPPEVAKVYGEKPTELKVKIPVNSLDVVFPRAYKYYGSSRGLKCIGDLENAFRLNEKTHAMEQVPCPCQFRDKECQPSGTLNVLLPEVSVKGVYQIGTRSWNSMVDVASGLEYVQCLMGQFAMVPLILKRIPTTTHHQGKKQTHYSLQILLDTESPEFPKELSAPKDGQYALPPAEEVRPDLDGPVTTEEELLAEGPLAAGTEPGANDMSSVMTPTKQIVVRTERDEQGRAIKKFKIQRHEYLREPYGDPHPHQVEMKAAQLGLSLKRGVPEKKSETFACPPSLSKKIKGVKYFEVSAGHGDSAALREITRRWSFHGTRRGLRPSAFLCGIPFGFNGENVDPGRCFRKSHRHPRAQSKLSPQKQVLKVKGAKSTHSVTGGGRLCCWPGGSGGTRRKHRSG